MSMIKLICIICLFSLTLDQALCVQKVLGVIPERASLYDETKNFACLDGSNSIPFSQVNDDYCDCRDGSDEPGTAACLNGQFACENLGYIVQMIPSGRVNDGICDCCDGSDEIDVKCENTCNVLAAKLREEEQRVKILTEQGLNKKKELIEQGNQIKKSIQDSIEDLKTQKASMEKERSTLEELKKAAQEKTDTAKAAQDLIFAEKDAELAKIETEKKAKILFDLLDFNKDSILKPIELLSHPELDTLFDNDGSFTIEESIQLLDNNQEVNLELFSSTYYEKISPHVDTKTEDHSEKNQEEGSEDGHEELNEDEHEEEVVTEPVTEKIEHKYDEETQRLIDESEELNRKFNDHDKVYQSLEGQIREKNKQLEHDTGAESEFASMIEKCYEYDDREYIYKLCPFDKAVQVSKANNGETSIGKWASWGPEDKNKYMTMKFENGLACWNGPQRSTKVILSCGLENKVISVAEPNKCEYEMKFETPAVCSTSPSQGHEEL